MLKEIFELLILESGKLLTLLAYGAEGRDLPITPLKVMVSALIFMRLHKGELKKDTVASPCVSVVT